MGGLAKKVPATFLPFSGFLCQKWRFGIKGTRHLFRLADNAGYGARGMANYTKHVRSKYNSHIELFDINLPWSNRDAIEVNSPPIVLCTNRTLSLCCDTGPRAVDTRNQT